MDYPLLINSISKYTKEELIYREYYETLQNNQPLSPFLDKYKDQTRELQELQHPEKIDFNPSEDRFISLDRNVSIIKHPRYYPLFYHDHAFFEMIYVLSGSCTQIFENREIQLKAGDLCIMAPKVVHGIKVFDDSIILNILIRRSTFLDIFINTVRDKTQISMFFLNNIYEKTRFLICFFIQEVIKSFEIIFWTCIRNRNIWMNTRIESSAVF